MPVYKALTTQEKKQHSSYFLQVIETASATNNTVSDVLQLPYFHTCRGKEFRDIFTSGILAPTECSEFNETLLYLFYGKPAYRVSNNGKSSKNLGRFPVTFVVELDNTDPVSRVFPFDTGALTHKTFLDICGEDYNPAKYELGNSISDIKKFILAFYGSDNAYFHGKVLPITENFDGMSFELANIRSLITENTDKEWDNRAMTIEVQSKTKIPLAGGKIKAVVLPVALLNSAEVSEFFYDNNIEPITYTHDRSNPAHLTPMIAELIKNYYETRGLL